MDLNLLSTFSSVYKHCSITKAADELELSQPAISAALKRLEVQIGKQLFVRSGRGISPTSSAIALAHKIEEPLTVMQSVGESFESLTLYCRENLQLFIHDIDGLVIYEAPLEEDVLIDDLIQQKVDLVLDVLSVTSSALVVEPLFEEPAVSVCRIDHPRINGSIALDHYYQEQHIALKIRRNGQNAVEFLSDGPQKQRNIAIETSSLASLLMLSSKTDFIGSCPQSLALAWRETLGLQVLPMPLGLKKIRYNMIYHKRFQYDEFHIEMRRKLKQRFASL
ncbi:LysR family transcriptional regulator [Alginatibacterium sediminis]|uniref:LysR family transcriptional regulator n=1 Tax=Alginatibacterium sediminis TaxID=2164068 RepID=A0A420EDI9_9ALTE|nr:LysR family transcriptional regulator [Alginatibacterium sediminis]RKF18767.1 LysR family transcriptional regulator [Alginatibacterium sediminis]